MACLRLARRSSTCSLFWDNSFRRRTSLLFPYICLRLRGRVRVVRSWIRVRFRGSCTLVISFIVSYLAFSASHLAFSVSIELTLNVKGNVEVRGKGMCKGKENYEG